MGDSVVSGMLSLWFVVPYGKGPALGYKGNQIEGAACIGIITITTATIISPNKDLTLSPCILEGLWKG